MARKRWIIRAGSAYYMGFGEWTDDRKKAWPFYTSKAAYAETLKIQPFGIPAHPACEVEEK